MNDLRDRCESMLEAMTEDELPAVLAMLRFLRTDEGLEVREAALDAVHGRSFLSH